MKNLATQSLAMVAALKLKELASFKMRKARKSRTLPYRMILQTKTPTMRNLKKFEIMNLQQKASWR